MEEEKEECEPPLPLSEDDSKSQAQDTFVMYENPCYIDDVSTQNPILIYDNLCFIDKSYDNPLFTPTIEMHDNEELCLESL